MKTFSFIFCALLLVSCGKKNTSGSRTNNFQSEPFRQDAEIYDVVETRNGVTVQGSAANFRIPVINVLHIFKSRNIIGVIYSDRGMRVKVYNAVGTPILNMDAPVVSPRLYIGDNAATLEIEVGTKSRVIAVNVTGKTLFDITADSARAEAAHSVAVITYRRNGVERALAMKANGKILLPDNKDYVRPRFTIDPYVLIFRHDHGVEQFRL